MMRIAFDFIFKSHLFKPTHIANSFDQVLHISQQQNIKFIIFDKDDTLTTLHQFTITEPLILSTIAHLSRNHTKMVVLSNSIQFKDPQTINGIPILRTNKKKPYNKDEISVIANGFRTDEVMIVGDRLMTDVYLANLLGFRSILVPQLQPSTVAKHGLPVFLFRILQKIYLRGQR